jgi:hypothetical protein
MVQLRTELLDQALDKFKEEETRDKVPLELLVSRKVPVL